MAAGIAAAAVAAIVGGGSWSCGGQGQVGTAAAAGIAVAAGGGLPGWRQPHAGWPCAIHPPVCEVLEGDQLPARGQGQSGCALLQR